MRRPPPQRLRHVGYTLALALLAAAGAPGCALVDPTPPAVMQPAAPPVHLVLRLGERRLYLIDADPTAPTESFPIAVGRKGHETPPGRYKVEEKIVHPDFVVIDPADRSRIVRRIPPGPANPLGERWIGIILGEGWTIGIHGTPRPELLGQAVSGGCIRMRNADVLRIYEKVDIGTPVVIEP